MSKNLRELEQRNDELEETARRVTSLLDNIQSEINARIEENEFLKTEIEERSANEEHLKEEIKGEELLRIRVKKIRFWKRAKRKDNYLMNSNYADLYIYISRSSFFDWQSLPFRPSGSIGCEQFALGKTQRELGARRHPSRLWCVSAYACTIKFIHMRSFFFCLLLSYLLSCYIYIYVSFSPPLLFVEQLQIVQALLDEQVIISGSHAKRILGIYIRVHFICIGIICIGKWERAWWTV